MKRSRLRRDGRAVCHSRLAGSLRLGVWKRFSSSTLKVILVDGEQVRNIHSVKFVLSGHDKVDKFIPNGEVWLEKSLSGFDRRALLVHELWERRLMVGGMKYDDAHERADRLEQSVRKLSTVSVEEILDKLVEMNR
jgi:hypothetical protein